MVGMPEIFSRHPIGKKDGKRVALFDVAVAASVEADEELERRVANEDADGSAVCAGKASNTAECVPSSDRSENGRVATAAIRASFISVK